MKRMRSLHDVREVRDDDEVRRAMRAARRRNHRHVQRARNLRMAGDVTLARRMKRVGSAVRCG